MHDGIPPSETHMPRPPADPNAPPKEPKPDLPSTGIDHIRSVHPDAMKIWTIKGPKEQGGELLGRSPQSRGPSPHGAAAPDAERGLRGLRAHRRRHQGRLSNGAVAGGRPSHFRR